MKLLTKAAALRLPNAPSATALDRMLKSKTPPAFAVKSGSSVKINIEHEAWKILCEPTAEEAEDELLAIRHQSLKAKLMEPILKADKMQYDNELRKVQLAKEAGELIEYQLAEFLFFGYLERVNVELLSLPKKVAPLIDNLVAENNPEGILALLSKEFGVILTEIKMAQKRDLKRWKDGNDDLS